MRSARRCHIRNAPPVQQYLLTFVREWHGLWSALGERREGWSRYRELLNSARRDLLALGAGAIALGNTAALMQALDAWVFNSALADRRSDADPEIRQRPGAAPGAGVAPAVVATMGDPVFDRPVFIVSPPRSGSTLLFETLAQAAGVCTIGDESHQLIEGLPQLAPESRGFDSNRLTADDATPSVADALRLRFFEALRDRDGRRPTAGQRVRMLEKTPKNSLRVPFLAHVFPEAQVHLSLSRPATGAVEHDRGLDDGSVSNLPAIAGLDRSGVVAAARPRLARADRPSRCTRSWLHSGPPSTRLLIDDLQALPADRRTVARYDALVADPAAEIARVCEATLAAMGS